MLDLSSSTKAIGIAISGRLSQPPASSTATLTSGSSLRRAASTHPADPAPTIT